MAKNTIFAIIAGEASGDILGADLIEGLKTIYPQATFVGIGGPRMKSVGLQSWYPMERLSVMGLVEPLKRLPELLRMRAAIKRRLLALRPTVFIGIDSPDFVMNIEKEMKANGIASVHYVSPSVWAWRKNRIHKIKRCVDLMLTLFPFEMEIYQQHDIDVVCVGHPLADQIGFDFDQVETRRRLGVAEDGQYLALLPGSRRGEIVALLPCFIEAFLLQRQINPELQALLPIAADHLKPLIDEYLSSLSAADRAAIHLVQGHSHDVMVASNAVLLSSGTATLEAMLLRRPMVVAYRMGGMSYAILSRLVKTPYISLPNLLAQQPLVPELIQDDANAENISYHLSALLGEGESRVTTLQTFDRLHRELRKNAGQTASLAIKTLIENSV